MRIDTTLVGFESLTWVRGNISFIFNVEEDQAKLVLVDHQRQVVQTLWPKDFGMSDKEIQEEISISLNSPINSQPLIDASALSIKRAQSGFWNFKYDRNDKIEEWETSVWNVESLHISSETRREHLSAYPLPSEKLYPRQTPTLAVANPDQESDESDLEAEIEEYKYGYRNIDDVGDDHQESIKSARKAFRKLAKFRDSLHPPPLYPISLKEYLSGSESLHLGRPLELDKQVKSLQATLWMNNSSDNVAFPIKVSSLLPLLQLIGMGSQSHVQTLLEFFNFKLPPGFPVQVEIPMDLLPLSATIRFNNISTSREMDASLFCIPSLKDGFISGNVI